MITENEALEAARKEANTRRKELGDHPNVRYSRERFGFGKPAWIVEGSTQRRVRVIVCAETGKIVDFSMS